MIVYDSKVLQFQLLLKAWVLSINKMSVYNYSVTESVTRVHWFWFIGHHSHSRISVHRPFTERSLQPEHDSCFQSGSGSESMKWWTSSISLPFGRSWRWSPQFIRLYSTFINHVISNGLNCSTNTCFIFKWIEEQRSRQKQFLKKVEVGKRTARPRLPQD